MKELLFGFLLFISHSSFAEEIRSYDCSAVSHDQSGGLSLVLAGDIESRGYFIKYSKGKISEISGILIDSDAVLDYLATVKQHSAQPKTFQFGFFNEGNPNNMMAHMSNFVIMAMAYKMQSKFMAGSPFGNGMGLGGMAGGVGGGLVSGNTGVAIDPYPARTSRETRPGALIRPYGEGTIHPSQESVGQENVYIETRPGALIQPRSEPSMPALGQLIGRAGVTTFTAFLNPLEEISRLSYRHGQDSQVSLPSQNRAKDQKDLTLNQIKIDMDKIKQLTRCCISGSNRSCDGKNIVRAEDLMKAQPVKKGTGASQAPASR